MNTSRAILMLLSIGLISCASKNASNPTPVVTTGGGTTVTVPTKDYTFSSTASWSDEFDGAAVDTTKWGYETGAGGWGNHELEYYTPGNNVTVTNGNLVITAKKEAIWPGANYSSARLLSKGSGNFTYGRIEIRAKVPAGKGTWPAIWMLPTDNAYGVWPHSGEMDIMEHVGYDPDNVYITFHTGIYNSPMKTQKGTTVSLPTSTSDFHIYRIDWTPASVTAFIDGQQLFIFKNEGTGSEAWPFDKRFHMMLNVAVGGDWGGAQGIDDTAFPTAMLIDYIRVYNITNL